MFELDERLRSDTFPVGSYPLCRILLMDNRLWPWLILVPQRAGARELHHLSPDDAFLFTGEMRRAATAIETLFKPDKINVGALGNVVAQLHIHVLGRFRGDPAWPGPVWGTPHRECYESAEAEVRVTQLRAVLGV